MAETVHEYIDEEKVNARIAELGRQISEDFHGESLYVICVLKGAVYFACELTKRISVPVRLDFMSASSYGDSTVSSGEVKITRDVEEELEGRNVLVVEDIVDTGRTLKALMGYIESKKPKRLKLCALLDKPERRVVDISADYTGFEVPDEFIVGYGLDYAQKYRNLPYIATLEIKEDTDL